MLLLPLKSSWAAVLAGEPQTQQTLGYVLGVGWVAVPVEWRYCFHLIGGG